MKIFTNFFNIIRLMGVCAVFFIVSNTHAQSSWYSQETIVDAHDPAIYRSGDVFTLLSTNNLLTVRQSDNMVSWRNEGHIFNQMPSWIYNETGENIEDIWAPGINFFNNKFLVYYCASVFGTSRSVIGLVTNPTLDPNNPSYSWTDQGMVIKTTEGANYNAIDPDFIVDKNGKTWMTFGSWWTGIQLIEIDPATGKQSGDNKNVYNIANRGGDGIEGPSIVYTNGYYYLFTAWDVCCEGVNSTYRTMVGRAQEITGPYSDRNGRSCLDGYAEEFLTSYGRYYGPGGGSVFKDGRFYRFVHHYYNGNRDGAPQLQIRDIVWDTDDWPLSGQPFLGRYLSLETEHAHLTNVEIRTSNQASNGEYVGMINYDDSKLIFPVNIPAAGQYRLQVRYANGDDDATLKIRVNNGNIQDLDCPSTGSYGIFPEGYVAFIDVQLQEGGNIIEFTKGINFSELDRIDIQRDGYTTIPATGFDNFSGITAEKSGTINYIADIDADDYAFFENIIFDTELETAIFRCANNSGDGVIEIRLDDAGGEMIGSCTITSTGSWDTWIDYSFSISQVSGVHDIYLIFKGNGDDLFRIENFHFAKEETAILSRYKNAKYNQFNRMTGRNQIVVVTDILGRELYRGYYSELSKSTFYRNRIGSGLYFITQYDGSIKKISKKMTLLGN